MKKIVTILVLSLSMMLAMTGCSKNEEDKDDSNDNSPTPVETNDNEDSDNPENGDVDIEEPEMLENPVVKEEYDFNDYIKLGKYKGIEVEVEQLEVSEDDVDLAIQMDMAEKGASLTDVTGRTAEKGDTLNIDFAGYHNGELFEGGSAEGQDLLLGSGMFIEGFEEQLIGSELNQEIDVNVVFPENYMNTTLAGEAAVFKVLVNGIKRYETTEEILKDIVGFDTEEAYKDYITQMLVESNAQLMKNIKENDIYNAVIDSSEITLPENLVEYHASDLRILYTNISTQYGMDLETFIMLSGITMEEFEDDIKAYANNMATRELLIKAISSAENLEVTEEEIDAEVEKYLANYGEVSKEQFMESADMEVIIEDILFNKIIKLLVDESVEI